MKNVWVLAGMVGAVLAGCATLPGPAAPNRANHPSVLVGAAYASAVGSYAQAGLAEITGNFAAAVPPLLNVLAADPHSTPIMVRTFQNALNAGEIATAADVATRLIAAQPGGQGQAMPQLVLMTQALRNGNPATALARLQRAASFAPEFVQFELLEAYLKAAAGQPPAALAAQVQAKQNLPKALQARQFFHAGRLFEQAGDQPAALAAYTQAHQVEPGALFTTVALVRLLQGQNDAATAAQVAAAYDAANPTAALQVGRVAPFTPLSAQANAQEDVALTLFDFALMVLAQGGTEPARQLMNISLYLAPDEPYINYYAGLIAEVDGDRTQAEARLNKLVGHPHLGVAARLRLAEMQYQRGHRRAAFKAADNLLKEHPSTRAIRRTVAEMAFDLKNYARAAQEYRALTRNLPPPVAGEVNELHAELWFALGAAEERRQRFTAATAAFRRSLQYNPANPQVLNYLGYMWVEQGINLAEAYPMLREALRLAPEDGAITDSVGWAYYKKGDYKTAVEYLERAVELEPEDPVIADHLGDAYAKLGQYNAALVQWRRAASLYKPADHTHVDHGFWPQLQRKIRGAR